MRWVGQSKAATEAILRTFVRNLIITGDTLKAKEQSRHLMSDVGMDNAKMNGASAESGTSGEPNTNTNTSAETKPDINSPTINKSVSVGSLDAEVDIDFDEANADADVAAVLARIAHAEDIARGAEGRLDALLAELDGLVAQLEGAASNESNNESIAPARSGEDAPDPRSHDNDN